MKVKGIALVSTLITLAIATSIITSLLVEQKSTVKKVQTSILYKQAMLYYFGVENLAKRMLLEDKNTKIDTCLDDWVKKIPPLLPLGESGVAKIYFYDLNSTLNINNIAGVKFVDKKEESANYGSGDGKDGDKEQETPKNNANVYFSVLEQRMLEQGFMQGVVNNSLLSISDWIDTNNDPSNREGYFGKENYYYLSLPTPYKTSNYPMVRMSELESVYGINATSFSQTDDEKEITVYEFFNSTEKYSCNNKITTNSFYVVPKINKISTININTADCKALAEVIYSYDTTKSFEDILSTVTNEMCPSGILAKRESEIPSNDGKKVEIKDSFHFSNLSGFFSALDSNFSDYLTGPNDKWENKLDKDLFDVKSNLFMLKTDISFGGCKLKLSTIFNRLSDSKVQVMSRKIANFFCK